MNSDYTVDFKSQGIETSPTISGKTSITLERATLDSDSTSLTLTGRGSPNWGEIQQENFIHLLEHFASKVAPENPTIGQIWFDSTVRTAKIYDLDEVWKAFVVCDVNGYITLVGAPTSALHPASKKYVDDLVGAIHVGVLAPGPVCIAATTAAITLSGLQTIDGVVLTAGARVLVKDQASPIANGIYNVASGAWTRATDFDTTPANEVLSGRSYLIVEGTANTGKRFEVTTADPITVGSSNITFAEIVEDEYVLPIASDTVLGGVKVGEKLAIDGSGVLIPIDRAIALGSVSGAQTANLALADVFSATIAGITTFSFTNPPVTGRVHAFIFELTNGGAFAITWPAAVSWVAGTAPTLRSSGKNIIGCFTRDGGTTYQAFIIA